MHIAMFAHYVAPHRGGVEAVVEALTSRLAARHRVTVVSSAWQGAVGPVRDGARTTWHLPAIHVTERLGVPYPVPTGPYIGDAMAEAEQADVVHVHGALYAHTMLARRLARRMARPLVLTEHVGAVPYPGALLRGVQSAAWSLVGDVTLREARATVALNTRVRDWLAGRGAHALALIPNGVDLARFVPGDAVARTRAREVLGLPDDEVLGLVVGREAPKKHRRAAVAADRRGWSLVLAGAPRAVHGPGVHDVGLMDPAAMPMLYHACDFLVHLAEGEGFPMAVQEAMATGLPVALRWDAGYGATLPREVVAAADTIEGTLQAADALAADAARRAETGVRGRVWATAHWSWEGTVAAYEALYEQVRGTR